MPVLTDEQHQQMLKKIKLANDKIQVHEKKLDSLKQSKNKIEKQRNFFLATSIVLSIILLILIIVYLFKPQLILSSKGSHHDEQVAQHSLIGAYYDDIAYFYSEIQTQSNESERCMSSQQLVSFSQREGAFLNFKARPFPLKFMSKMHANG